MRKGGGGGSDRYICVRWEGEEEKHCGVVLVASSIFEGAREGEARSQYSSMLCSPHCVNYKKPGRGRCHSCFLLEGSLLHCRNVIVLF